MPSRPNSVIQTDMIHIGLNLTGLSIEVSLIWWRKTQQLKSSRNHITLSRGNVIDQDISSF